MKKQKNSRCIAVLIVGLCICLLAGCSGEVTPKKIMNRIEKNLSEVTSFSNQVEMNIKMEELVHYTKVTMDMEMENTMEPKAGHAKGIAEVSMRGVNLNSQMEIYQVEEDGSQVTYSGLDGTWFKETAGESSGGIALDKNLFAEMGESADEFQLADETIELDGKSCYEMYGDVTGKELMSVLGSQMLHGFGLVELPDDSAVAQLEIPVIFDVYEEDLLPARMHVDMTDVLNDLYDSLGESADVTHYVIQLSFKEYNTVEEIQVPEEIRETAVEE